MKCPGAIASPDRLGHALALRRAVARAACTEKRRSPGACQDIPDAPGEGNYARIRSSLAETAAGAPAAGVLPAPGHPITVQVQAAAAVSHDQRRFPVTALAAIGQRWPGLIGCGHAFPMRPSPPAGAAGPGG